MSSSGHAHGADLPSQVTNDSAQLVPRTDFAGPTLEFDLDGVLVGCAEYDEGPTGCTAFVFPEGAAVSADVRGGAVGVVGDGYPWVAGICLAGGSLLGLEASMGLAAEIHAARGYPSDWMAIPAVAGAIIYDFHEGRTRVYPDKALGRAAARAAAPGRFPLGTRGAGRYAGVGQGAAVATSHGVTVVVCTVVNALGAIVDRSGRIVYGGNRQPRSARTIDEHRESWIAAGMESVHPRGNTTLTVLLTDARLDGRSLRQVGRQVHSSMARAIQPFHTMDDGDVLFAVTTGRGAPAEASALGFLASEVAWDAVLATAT